MNSKRIIFFLGIYLTVLIYLTKSVNIYLWYSKFKQHTHQLGEFILYITFNGVILFSFGLGYFTFYYCLKFFEKTNRFWWVRKSWHEKLKSFIGLLEGLLCLSSAIVVFSLAYSILTKGIEATFNVDVDRIMEKHSNCGNPYSESYQIGHYAGFRWAEENSVASCGGKSDSFIAGCEEYLHRKEACE